MTFRIDVVSLFGLKDINTDYWNALVLSLITAGGLIKLEEVWQAHSSGLFQVRSLRDLAICHIPGTCIVKHQFPLIDIIPLRGLLSPPAEIS